MNNTESMSAAGSSAADPHGGGANDGGGAPQGLGAHVDRVSGNAQEAWTSTRDAISDLRDRLDFKGRMARNPLGMLAAAVGAGYVLGGGIFSPLTARIVGLGLRVALRAAAIPFIKDELLGLVEAAAGDDDPDRDRQAKSAGGKRRRPGERRMPDSKSE